MWTLFLNFRKAFERLWEVSLFTKLSLDETAEKLDALERFQTVKKRFHVMICNDQIILFNIFTDDWEDGIDHIS